MVVKENPDKKINVYIMKFGKKIEIVSKKNLIMNNVKYLKSKVTSYYGKINTNFHNITKGRFSMYFLLVILISSVFRTVKSYYLQEFLEKCKYVVKKKRFLNILLKT